MGIRSFLSRKKNKSRQASPTSVSVPSSPLRISASGPPTPDPHIQELERVFKKFDVNGDGKISSEELGSILRSLRTTATEEELTEEELQKMVRVADSDGDGFIDLGEFIEINTKGLDSSAVLEDIRGAFHVFDRDGNGSISAEELHALMHSIGEKSSMSECEKMIKVVDSDGDGMVSFEEFQIMMTRTSPASSSA